MRYILNSAVIINPGTYEYFRIEIKEAAFWLVAYKWQSCIGYQETADALEALTGQEIPVNRTQIKMEVGDEALIFRLTKRVSDPGNKGNMSIDYVIANHEVGILRRTR